jgi:co-chaperonin GroES (HSP10)
MIKPIGEHLLVKAQAQSGMTESGIVFNAANPKGLTTGLVIESGDGWYNDKGQHLPNVAQRGDIIVFKRSAGRQVEAAGKKYTMIKNIDVLGKIKMPEQ